MRKKAVQSSPNVWKIKTESEPAEKNDEEKSGTIEPERVEDKN